MLGEGGNLGCTQRARDRGGVRGRASTRTSSTTRPASTAPTTRSTSRSCSTSRAAARSTAPSATRVLRAVTDDVVAHVLQDSYRQARILAQEVERSRRAHLRLRGPDGDAGGRRGSSTATPTGCRDAGSSASAGARAGLHRPELAVLLAHAKRSLTDALRAPTWSTTRGSSATCAATSRPPIVERFGAPDPRAPAAARADGVVAPTRSSTRSARRSSRGSRPSSARRRRGRARLPDRARRHRRGGALRHDRRAGAALDASAEARADRGRRAAGRGRRRAGTSPRARRSARRSSSRRATRASTRSRTLLRGRTAEGGRAAAEHAERWRPRRAGDAGRQAHALRGDLAARARRARGGRGDRPQPRGGRQWSSRSATGCASAGSRTSSTRFRRPSGCSAGRCRPARRRLPARRALAQAALIEAEGAEPEEAVEAFFASRARGARRLAGLLRSLSREGETDLAGLTLAVRQLRSIEG